LMRDCAWRMEAGMEQNPYAKVSHCDSENKVAFIWNWYAKLVHVSEQ
jgi:hypothetical protein